MKELSIEEKAKAYDEALEKAKVFKEHLLEINEKDYADEMDYIFSQLRESKDEKVRKHLISLFEKLVTLGVANEYETYDIKIDDILAWLEKQGEQKPMKTCAEYYNKDSELKMPELSVFQNKLADILMQREYEGSTETEEDVARARLDYELAAIRISEELLPLAIEQKPAEWSKEDEELYNDLSDTYFHNDEAYPENTYKFMLKRVLDWMTKRAKSLRPQSHWRPSEKQMKWLHDAIESTQYEPRKQALVSLYSDLMELKE